jgi:uncharacterized membrane protein HdeD (DUF308 family)
VATAVGAGLLAWPDTTIRVLGLLFGLSLFVSGLTRVAVGVRGVVLPSTYRTLTTVLGGLQVALALACLRHAVGSATLLFVLVGLGLLLDGLTEFGIALACRDPSGFPAAVACTAVAVAILVWPALSRETFVAFAGLALAVLGVGEINAALRLARSADT